METLLRQEDVFSLHLGTLLAAPRCLAGANRGASGRGEAEAQRSIGNDNRSPNGKLRHFIWLRAV
jgi:hypothetical protein